MKNWIKKQKGLKRNGDLDNKYNCINKSIYLKFFENLFEETNWCYLTINFPKAGYSVNTLLWKDEIDMLKQVISVPFRYRIYENSSSSHSKFCLEIVLITIPASVKDAYEAMEASDFCEYYKKALKGY